MRKRFTAPRLVEESTLTQLTLQGDACSGAACNE